MRLKNRNYNILLVVTTLLGHYRDLPTSRLLRAIGYMYTNMVMLPYERCLGQNHIVSTKNLIFRPSLKSVSISKEHLCSSSFMGKKEAIHL